MLPLWLRSLYFGQPYPGQANPLDGRMSIALESVGVYEYFIKIVPTWYHTGSMFFSSVTQASQVRRALAVVGFTRLSAVVVSVSVVAVLRSSGVDVCIPYCCCAPCLPVLGHEQVPPRVH